jgi:hypothetical protein
MVMGPAKIIQPVIIKIQPITRRAFRINKLLLPLQEIIGQINKGCNFDLTEPGREFNWHQNIFGMEVRWKRKGDQVFLRCLPNPGNRRLEVYSTSE